MGDTPRLSNSAGGKDIAGVFSQWRESIAKAAGALSRYAAEAGNAGIRHLGSRWSDAVSTTISHLAAPGVPAEPAPGEPAPTELQTFMACIAACDELDAALDKLQEAAAIILSPKVRNSASAGFSQTFSENIALMARTATNALGAAAHARAFAGSELSAVGSGCRVADIAAAFESTNPHKETATEIYVNLLLNSTDDVHELLGRAKDVALGAAPDANSRQSASAELTSVYEAPDLGILGISYDCRITAGESPAYDLGRLIDRSRAAEFGPIASTVSGLSWKTVERLRTITASQDNSLQTALAGSTATITLGGQRTLRLEPADVGSDPTGAVSDSRQPDSRRPADANGSSTLSAWLPTGGVHDRVALYTAACAEMIMPGIRAAPRELVAEYESAQRTPTATEIDSDRLSKELYDAFLASAGQLTLEALIQGRYIGAVLATHGLAAVSTQMRELLIKGGGDRYIEAEREAQISAAVLAADTARTLRRHIAAQNNLRPANVDTTIAERARAVIRAAVRAAAPIYAATYTLKGYSALYPKN